MGTSSLRRWRRRSRRGGGGGKATAAAGVGVVVVRCSRTIRIRSTVRRSLPRGADRRGGRRCPPPPPLRRHLLLPRVHWSGSYVSVKKRKRAMQMPKSRSKQSPSRRKNIPSSLFFPTWRHTKEAMTHSPIMVACLLPRASRPRPFGRWNDSWGC